MKKVLLGTLGAVLLAAVLLQGAAVLFFREAPQIARAPLSECLPSRVLGWDVTDVPVAETEEIKRAVGELLNYDEALFRRYRRGPRGFDVYVAYWKPGKMSHRLVAGHTPDVCWVQAGWKMGARNSDYVFGGPSGFLKPAQYREFSYQGTQVQVAFWHLAGGEPISYGADRVPWRAIFNDIARYGLAQRREQYFIRISSAQRFEELTADSGFIAVLKGLAELGAGGRGGRAP